jgi:hypothetical protein
MEITNTILNDNSGPNIDGTGTSLGYNVSSDDGGGNLTGPGDQIDTGPLLGPLQNNGGPTLTHALLPDSPAISAVNQTSLRHRCTTSVAAFLFEYSTVALISGHLKCIHHDDRLPHRDHARHRRASRFEEELEGQSTACRCTTGFCGNLSTLCHHSP